MSRRRTVDASTLLDLTWSTNHFPLPPPDGASPLRPSRATTASALPPITPTPPRRSLTHSTPQVQPEQCLETPPRQNLVVAMTTDEEDDDDDDDDDDDAPMSPRGAPDGRVEMENSDEVANSVERMRPSLERLSSRPGSLGGGRTETEDDEESSSDEDDRSDVSDIVVREEEQDPFSTSTGLPKTFNLTLSYEDRFEAYVYDILGNASVDQVHRLFKGYMEENILPNGWLGIWRSGGVFGAAPLGESTASVLVEIENVVIVADEEKLDAVATVSLPGGKGGESSKDNHNERDFRAVVVNHPGSPNSSIFNNSWSNPRDSVASSVETLTLPEVESVLETRDWTVPLLDVHPVFQRHGGAKLTATALEHIRFFYKHIWRAWDSDIAKDEPYASQCLQSRMALHYDMEEGKVNPEDQEKYEKTVSQYEDVRTRLKALHNSMDVSDSENELDEADVAQCAALYEREMALETAIQALENPLLRFLQHDTNFSKMKRQLAQRMRGETCESVTHLVAKVFRARMASCLDPDTVVEHHPTLTSAMENFCGGDIIHIHEGVYSGVSLRSTPSGTCLKGQSLVCAVPSPGPKRRPVQVSESLYNEPKNDGQKQNDETKTGALESNEGKCKDDAEEGSCPATIGAAIELQVAFNSNVLIDVDPESGPVTIANLTLRHLLPPVGSDGSKSQEPSPSRGGSNGAETNAVRDELICVKRGCLVLDRVTLLVASGVGVSVREGATLKMNDCVIRDASGAAVVAHPDSTLEIGDAGVKYVDCAAEVLKTATLGHLTATAAALNASAETEASESCGHIL